MTLDMSENGAVPSLSGDQCGDFYYMYPLTQFILGICNNATRFMNSYIWGKDTANRGASNIVPCLYWGLARQGIIGGAKVKILVVLAHNYLGQNKKFFLLKFCT